MTKKAVIVGLGILALLGAVGLVLAPRENRLHARARKDWKDRAIAEIAHRAADTNWLAIETGTLRKRAAHEPHPLTPSLSPTGGEGARRAGEGEAPRFMAGEQVRKEQGVAQQDAGYDAWFTDRLILMTNGQWIVYASKCSKEDPRIHDIFIGRGSDGKWYYSTFHFCVGMVVLRMEEQPPASLAQFVWTYFLREFDGLSDDCLQKTWPPERGAKLRSPLNPTRAQSAPEA